MKKKNIRKLNLGFQTLLQCHVTYYVFCHVTITYFVEVFEDLSASFHSWIWRYSTGIWYTITFHATTISKNFSTPRQKKMSSDFELRKSTLHDVHLPTVNLESGSNVISYEGYLPYFHDTTDIASKMDWTLIYAKDTHVSPHNWQSVDSICKKIDYNIDSGLNIKTKVLNSRICAIQLDMFEKSSNINTYDNISVYPRHTWHKFESNETLVNTKTAQAPCILCTMQLTIWKIARMLTDTSNSLVSTRDATGITSKVTRTSAQTNRCNCSRLSSFILSIDHFFLI